jgi:hypothetical protein
MRQHDLHILRELQSLEASVRVLRTTTHTPSPIVEMASRLETTDFGVLDCPPASLYVTGQSMHSDRSSVCTSTLSSNTPSSSQRSKTMVH